MLKYVSTRLSFVGAYLWSSSGHFWSWNFDLLGNDLCTQAHSVSSMRAFLMRRQLWNEFNFFFEFIKSSYGHALLSKWRWQKADRGSQSQAEKDLIKGRTGFQMNIRSTMTNQGYDGKSTAESEPTSGRSKEGDRWHRLCPGQLLVVRVFQENLTRDALSTIYQLNHSHPDNNEIVFSISGNGFLKLLLSSSDLLAWVWVARVENIVAIVTWVPVRTVVRHVLIWG